MIMTLCINQIDDDDSHFPGREVPKENLCSIYCSASFEPVPGILTSPAKPSFAIQPKWNTFYPNGDSQPKISRIVLYMVNNHYTVKPVLHGHHPEMAN